MAYVASTPETYIGKVVGTGQCVAFVQQTSNAPHTIQWNRGRKVKGDTTVPKGTAIATFDSAGKYTNSLDGSSHAAIYISQDALGLQVWDQWTGQPVHQRTLHFRGGGPGVRPDNDGDAFYVIE